MQAAPILCWLLSCPHFTVPSTDVLAGPFAVLVNVTPAAAQAVHCQATRRPPRRSVGVTRGRFRRAPGARRPWSARYRPGCRASPGQRDRAEVDVIDDGAETADTRPPASSGSPVAGRSPEPSRWTKTSMRGGFPSCGPAPRFPGRDSTPCPDARRHARAARSSPPHGGSSVRRCPRRARHAERRPGSLRTPTSRPGARLPAASRASQSVTSARRTRRSSSMRPGSVGVRRTKPVPIGRAVDSAGSSRHAQGGQHAGSARRGPSSESTARSAASGARRPRTPSSSDRRAGVRRARLGVEVGDATQLGLHPVVFDTALPVEAEVLGGGAVGLIADMLLRSSAASSPVGSGQRDDARFERSTTMASCSAARCSPNGSP